MCFTVAVRGNRHLRPSSAICCSWQCARPQVEVLLQHLGSPGCPSRPLARVVLSQFALLYPVFWTNPEKILIHALPLWPLSLIIVMALKWSRISSEFHDVIPKKGQRTHKPKLLCHFIIPTWGSRLSHSWVICLGPHYLLFICLFTLHPFPSPTAILPPHDSLHY